MTSAEERGAFPAAGDEPSADMRLVQQLHRGDAGAGYRFFHEYYPRVYRYLLWLTGRPEQAEDLAQETFLRAWKALPSFDDRAPLQAWLHRIAHREFLRMLRSRKEQTSLEAMGEPWGGDHHSAPQIAEWAEAVMLRSAIRQLPQEEGEAIVLHYLEGYNSDEIARIVGAPAGTVRYRLSTARTRLRGVLGEGDLAYMNEQPFAQRHWSWLPLDRLAALESRLAGRDRDPGGELASGQSEAGAGVEDEVVDDRLSRKVTLALKATALGEICDRLRVDTGVEIAAGPSVTDEKVTLFCRQVPLRDVMRQLSRPFGYTWRRSEGRPYRYELLQETRSQLLEEELRQRDRNAAWLSLEEALERFRPFLHLTPDEALARSTAAAPEEKPLLETLSGLGWAPIQLYFRLSHPDLEALRAGQTLVFSGEPGLDERRLPKEIERGVFQSYRDWSVLRDEESIDFAPRDRMGPDSLPLQAVPEARGHVRLRITQSELGHFAFGGTTGVFAVTSLPKGFATNLSHGPYAVGQNLAPLHPDNRRSRPRHAREAALRSRITLFDGIGSQGDTGSERALDVGNRVTSADVLEALHQATGLSIVADYYTRLHPAAAVATTDAPVLDAVDRIADAMGLRCNLADDNWLQFRSAAFYHDRLKEVPNRLLARWAESRERQGQLTLDDLVEIAKLPDAQLDAENMADGATSRFGLEEWDLLRSGDLRQHLRYLARFTPEQREQAMSANGLPFTRMTATQQQQFLAFAAFHEEDAPFTLEDLAGAVLRVDYTQPGGFQWGDPDLHPMWFSWVVPIEPGRDGRRVLRPPVRERTREAALEAVQRIDPRIRAATVVTWRDWKFPQGTAEPAPLESQVFPTRLGLTFIYVPSSTNARQIGILTAEQSNWQVSW